MMRKCGEGLSPAYDIIHEVIWVKAEKDLASFCPKFLIGAPHIFSSQPALPKHLLTPLLPSHNLPSVNLSTFAEHCPRSRLRCSTLLVPSFVLHTSAKCHSIPGSDFAFLLLCHAPDPRPSSITVK